MNILSLFDGISCAKLALEKAGININKYYASEVDKFAIQVSKANHPEIIHLGDVRNINIKTLPKIDILIGGSPCQDLSNAQSGLGLKGEKSRLFYEYIRILEEVKPKYFLLENVKNKWAEMMSDIVGVDFIDINSNLFSAQSRPRYYWTNIKHNVLPTKLSVEVLKDIVCDSVDEKYYYKKQPVLDYLKDLKFDNKKNSSKDGILKKFEFPRDVHNDKERQRRVYDLESKSPTLLARSDTTKIYHHGKVRKLTPLECERLQKIPDNYTSCCSDTQRYKMIGNAFTVDVIAHLLKGINE
jgi:DNA-cytosine methyltransferase